jgi:hypothetical protein
MAIDWSSELYTAYRLQVYRFPKLLDEAIREGEHDCVLSLAVYFDNPHIVRTVFTNSHSLSNPEAQIKVTLKLAVEHNAINVCKCILFDILTIIGSHVIVNSLAPEYRNIVNSLMIQHLTDNKNDLRKLMRYEMSSWAEQDDKCVIRTDYDNMEYMGQLISLMVKRNVLHVMSISNITDLWIFFCESQKMVCPCMLNQPVVNYSNHAAHPVKKSKDKKKDSKDKKKDKKKYKYHH